MTRWILLFATAGSTVLNSCVTSGLSADASAGLFQASLSGDTGREGTMRPLAEIDVDDLDLDDEPTSVYGKVRLSAAGLNLWASGFDLDQDGQATLTQNFGDITPETQVDTEYEIRALQAGISYNLLDAGGVRLAPGVGVDYFDVNLKATDRALSMTEEVDELAPIPLLFLDGSLDPPAIPLTLEAHLGGIAGTFDDFDGLLLDGEATLHLTLLDPLDVYAGYRYIQFELDGTDDGEDFTADLVLDGFIVGAGLRF